MNLPFLHRAACPEADAVAGRAKRDGCDCPPWVLRCVHFDGQDARISDRTLAPLPHAECLVSGLNGRFVVSVVISERVLPCPMCGEPKAGFLDGDGLCGYEGDSEADAIAAFEAEEARLSGRVPS